MRNLAASLMLCVLLVGCSRDDVPDETLKSPNGDYLIGIYGKDLGACCSSRVHASITSNAGAFDGLDERIFEIEGGSDVNVIWRAPYFVEVQVCNAKSVSYKSDFSSSDFSKHIHVVVENALPQRANGEVICPAISQPNQRKSRFWQLRFWRYWGCIRIR